MILSPDSPRLDCLAVYLGLSVRWRDKTHEETPMAAHRRSTKHLWRLLALAPLAAALPGVSLLSSPAWAGSALIYVTNSAGDNIHVIDPATNKVVQEIKGIECAHGIVPRTGSCRRQTARGSMSATRPRPRSMCSIAPAAHWSRRFR